MSINIEELVKSTMPKSESESRRLTKILSKVSIGDYEGIRTVIVPKDSLGIIHDGCWYCWNTLRDAKVIEVYEKTRRERKSLVVDCYGKLWYNMDCDDNIYDDFQMVYIRVQKEKEAESLFHREDLNTYTFFCGAQENKVFPHIRSCITDFMWYETDEMVLSPEEYMIKLVENNVLL